jgi:hypothetical protein
VAIVGEGTADGATIASDDLCLRVRAAGELPLDGPHPADTLLQCLLGVAVRLVHRLGGFVEVREVTQLVRHLGQGVGHGPADGVLAVGDPPDKRDGQRLLDRLDQGGQVFLGGRQQAVGQEHFGGETIAPHPENLLPDIGWEAIKRQDDPALGVGDLLEAGGVCPRERHQCLIAFHQRQDRPGRNDDVTPPQLLMDLWDTPVLAIA